MIEKEIFKKNIIKEDKCLKYGFKKKENQLIYHKNMKNKSFEIIVTIQNNEVTGKIIDKELQEEYFNYRIENQIGEFVSSIREEYINTLKDIRDHCTITKSFVSKQANRMSNWIKEVYNDSPEYLWDNDKDAVFRNKLNKKWYGIIMYINRNKIDKKDEMVEAMNVKLPPEMIDKLVQKKGYFRAYHMNKKHWITFILDETLTDKELQDLINISYQFTVK